ncbi:hypothetical protein EWM64_g6572 [Hericium alpestre]|uniref:Uncharacterized protein n=1 Tax=Hericium alpestre TaxID=135208 RepID=A0A4Y9ZRN5_9AGAM|nr:hypothetical protein EWM64_g6572 [Hericium alpestre]
MHPRHPWHPRHPQHPQPAEADAPADFGTLTPAHQDFAVPLSWQNDFNADFLQNAGGQGLGAGNGAAATQHQNFEMPAVNPAYFPNPLVDQQAFQAPMAAPQNFRLYPQAQNLMNFDGAGAPFLPDAQSLYQSDFPPALFNDAFVNQSVREYTRASVDVQTGGAQQLASVGQYQENMNAQPVLGHHSNSPFSDAAFWTSGHASPVDQSDMAVSTPSHNGSVPSFAMSSSSFQQEYPVRDNRHQAWDNSFGEEPMLMNPQRFLSPACDPVPGPSRIPFDQKVNNWMGEIPMSTCSGPVTPPARTEESSSGSSSFSVGSSGDTSTDFESSINDLRSRGTSPTSSEEVAYGLCSGMSEADVSFKSPSPLPIREDASAIGSYRGMDEDSVAGMSPAAFSIRETGLEKDLNPEMFAAIQNERTPSPCPPSPQYDSFTMDSAFF